MFLTILLKEYLSFICKISIGNYCNIVADTTYLTNNSAFQLLFRCIGYNALINIDSSKELTQHTLVRLDGRHTMGPTSPVPLTH